MVESRTIRNVANVVLFVFGIIISLSLVSSGGCGGGASTTNTKNPGPLADAALNAPSPDDRRAAMRELTQSQHPETIVQIRRVLAESKDPEIKAEAITAIMNRNDFDSMPELLKILHWTSDEHPSVLMDANSATDKLTGVGRPYPAEGPRDDRMAAYKDIEDDYKVEKKRREAAGAGK